MYLFRNSLVDLVVLEVTKFVYVAAIEKADSNRLQKENKGEKKKRKEKKQVASIVMCQSYLIWLKRVPCYPSIHMGLCLSCPMFMEGMC